MLVGIADGELRPPPYVIENQTSVELTMQQKGAPQKRKVLAAHGRTSFAWHAPAGKRVLELTAGGTKERQAKQNVMEVRPPPAARSHVHAACASRARGQPRVMRTARARIPSARARTRRVHGARAAHTRGTR